MDIPGLQKWLSEPRPALIKAVAEGIRTHVDALRKRGIEFYGYALHPGEPYDIHSIVAVTNSETDIKVSRDDSQYSYYRYSVDEWAHWDHDGFVAANSLLAEANERFRSIHSKAEDDYMMDEFEVAHANVLLECMVHGLEAARADGVFGSNEPFLVVWISDSSHQILVESAQRLNSASVATEFVKVFA